LNRRMGKFGRNETMKRTRDQKGKGKPQKKAGMGKAKRHSYKKGFSGLKKPLPERGGEIPAPHFTESEGSQASGEKTGVDRLE